MTNSYQNQFTDDALAQAFASEVEGSCLYVPGCGRWYVRETDASGAPFWAPDERLRVWTLVRLFLRGVADDHPNVSGGRLGSAELIKAIEFLARSDLAGDETELEPGELAKAEARSNAFREACRAPAGWGRA